MVEATFNELKDLLSSYCTNKEFLKKQNELAELVYKSLRFSYMNNDDEIKMVENLCDSINGQEYEKIHIYLEKIHGKKSIVDFSVQGTMTHRELADLVLLSLITKDDELVYSKIAFVQNKKEDKIKGNWKIDKGQLFLLQNFPTFKGLTGIFNNGSFKNRDIVFPNVTGSLGNYGLFQSDGEMVMAIASEISAKMKGCTVKFSSLAEDSSRYNTKSLIMPPLDLDYTTTILHSGYISFKYPFMQKVSFSMNVYDFIRNFTQFNIGEQIVSPSGDNDLYEYLQILIQGTSLKDKIKIRGFSDNQQYIYDENLAVLCVHLDLGKK